MASFPATDLWSIRTLRDADENSALCFLGREPLHNVYLISRILDEGFSGSEMVEVRYDGETVCLATLGSNIVVSHPAGIPEKTRSGALAMIAAKILTSRHYPRAIICDATVVEELWSHMQRRLDPPTVVRLSQPVYFLENRPELHGELRRVRYSTLEDLDALVPACAAMHREEVGIDPLQRDAIGYRQRIRELVLKRRSIVLLDHGRIAFKAEFSAVTSKAVQLMGVWTAPELRRKGLARIGLAELCGHVLRQGKAVTLFVNDFNRPAIALYESLGFRRAGENRALIW